LTTSTFAKFLQLFCGGIDELASATAFITGCPFQLITFWRIAIRELASAGFFARTHNLFGGLSIGGNCIVTAGYTAIFFYWNRRTLVVAVA
jgi:hypothetical protein